MVEPVSVKHAHIDVSPSIGRLGGLQITVSPELNAGAYESAAFLVATDGPGPGWSSASIVPPSRRAASTARSGRSSYFPVPKGRSTSLSGSANPPA